MKKDESILDTLQSWYLSQCDGDWEHEYGIKIDTLDNPGWTVEIDLAETELENKPFEEIDQEYNPDNWYQCSVINKKFKGAGGPKNLKDIIRIFFEWKELEQ